MSDSEIIVEKPAEPSASLPKAKPVVEEATPARGSFAATWLPMVASWLASLAVHLSVLLFMGLMMVPPKVDARQDSIAAISATPEDEFFDSLVDLNPDPRPFNPSGADISQSGSLTGSDDGVLTDLTDLSEGIAGGGFVESFEPVASSSDIGGGAPGGLISGEIGIPLAGTTSLGTGVGSLSGTGLEGRSGEMRKMLVARGGGSSASEAAVARALDWIIRHQMPDGGWDFDHQHGGQCNEQCDHPGSYEARNGATAMALLPLLGAGQTHREGKYRKEVDAGLSYLISNMKVTEGRGDLSDKQGRSYSHGLATIALCEAYAMTKDRRLAAPAQAALNYAVYLQDPVGGGWRYYPPSQKPEDMPGDTSAAAWQVMALKSGRLAGLKVDDKVFEKASAFLDSVQSKDGAGYGYRSPGRGAGTTAAGALCRMYLGWGRDHPDLIKSVKHLGRLGPSHQSSDLYMRYYATQVMSQFGGAEWRAWNRESREMLVSGQETKGHAAGSWAIEGDRHLAAGGRLYCTSMCTMMLEVYYRHMPLYQDESFAMSE